MVNDAEQVPIDQGKNAVPWSIEMGGFFCKHTLRP
jgi:hypothetical protein